jgi:hypothetical protein
MEIQKVNFFIIFTRFVLIKSFLHTFVFWFSVRFNFLEIKFETKQDGSFFNWIWKLFVINLNELLKEGFLLVNWVAFWKRLEDLIFLLWTENKTTNPKIFLCKVQIQKSYIVQKFAIWGRQNDLYPTHKATRSEKRLLIIRNLPTCQKKVSFWRGNISLSAGIFFLFSRKLSFDKQNSSCLLTIVFSLCRFLIISKRFS